MAIKGTKIYTNASSLPITYFNSISAITSSSQTNIVVPPTDLDVGGKSYSLKSQLSMSINSDSSWDFGQDIGTWTANHAYAEGDWVRAVTTDQSMLSIPESSILPTSTVYNSVTGYSLCAHTSIVYNNYMYVFGGHRGSPVNETYRLNLVTNNWDSSAVTVTGNKPLARQYHTSIVYNNYMYVFGGLAVGSVSTNDTHRLNLDTLEWSGELTTTGTPPTIRSAHVSVVVGNYMYVFGGSEPTSSDTNMYRLNLDTLAWDDAFTSSTAGTCSFRRRHVAGVYGTSIYIFGGRDAGSTYFNELHKFDTQTNSWSGALTTTGTKPTARIDGGAVVVDNYLYIIAGIDTSYYRNDVHRVNLDTLAWSGALAVKNNSFAPRVWHSSVIYQGVIYIFGGYHSPATCTDKLVYSLNIKHNNRLYKCTSAGTSLSSEPTWGTTVSGTTAESGGPTWMCYYDDTSASNRAGVDYYIYACQQTGLTPKLLLSRNSTYPHGYTANNSRKIGGFHGLCGSVGTIANHTLSGYLTGDILPQSVWYLKHRSQSGSNVGLVYVPPIKKWVGIYLTSGTSSAPTIVFGGTILDTITYFVSYGACRVLRGQLPKDSEFAVFAAGSNEATNILGSADPVTVTAAVDTAGRRMISNYGVEGCSGVLWQWLCDTSYRFDAATAHTHSVTVATLGVAATSGNASADVAPAWSWKANTGGKGSLYTQGAYGTIGLFAGGSWAGGAHSGSRSRFALYYPWYSYSHIGFRVVARGLTELR